MVRMKTDNRHIIRFRDNGWQYYLCHPWCYILDWYRDIEGFIERGRSGWARYDIWSLDQYIAGILVQAMGHLQRHNHGYPGIDGAETPEKWEAIIGKMISGFNAHIAELDIDTDWRDDELIAKLHKEQEEGMALFAKWFGALWD